MNNPCINLWHTNGNIELSKDQLIWQLISHLLGRSFVPGCVSIVSSWNNTHILIPMALRPHSPAPWLYLLPILGSTLNTFPHSFFHLIHFNNCIIEPYLVLNWLTLEYGNSYNSLKTSLYLIHHYLNSNLQPLHGSLPYSWMSVPLNIVLEMSSSHNYSMLLICESYALLWLRLSSCQAASIQLNGTLSGIQSSNTLWIECGNFSTPPQIYNSPIITSGGCVNCTLLFS